MKNYISLHRGSILAGSERGVRVNELLNIKPSDIKSHNSVVNIMKVKGGKQRRVHLDEETVEMLSEYVLAQQILDDEPIFAF